MKVLVTGATGFVGSALCARLAMDGAEVIPAVRGPAHLHHEVVIGDLAASTDWRDALVGCDAVVHLAARVHMINDTTANSLAHYRATNTAATLNLARQAAQAGVKRFVFISSIKVNGEGREVPYRETDAPAPADAYAISKWEAEQGLQHLAQETGLEVVILRPPLVYGPGVKANFLRLMRTVERGWPLPLRSIRNKRSLLYLGNLVDAIRLCLKHPEATGRIFLLDDGRPVSTPELIRALGQAMGRTTRLLAVPTGVLEGMAALLGKRAALKRLTGSLYLDSSAIRTHLGWTPLFSMEAGLAKTVAALA